MSEHVKLRQKSFACWKMALQRRAIARWRTLYEIEVVATVLADGKDALAERYLDHESVDIKRAADLYQSNYETEGSNPIPKKEIAKIDAAYRRILKKNGKSFVGPYGWASDHLGNANPRFSTLEAKAAGARLRNRDKAASYNVHASATSFSHNLGDLTGEGRLSVGASNAGLALPGHLTALTLVRVTYLLMSNLRKLDNLVTANAIIGVRDSVFAAFADADRLLREDDAAIRAAGEEHGFEVDTSYI